MYLVLVALLVGETSRKSASELVMSASIKGQVLESGLSSDRRPGADMNRTRDASGAPGRMKQAVIYRLYPRFRLVAACCAYWID